MTSFSDLLGKTIIKYMLNSDKTELYFWCSDGTKYKMYHQQDCCEDVYLDDIIGELIDLIGQPILLAEEVSYSSDDENNENLPPAKNDNTWGDDSWTWTFYKLATVFGYVTLRWYGSSNGYYSESVDFELVEGE